MMILIGALSACQLKWLFFSSGSFLIRFLKKGYKPLLIAAFWLYCIDNVDTILLFLPRISTFADLRWNWQGKILEFSLALLIIYGFKGLTPRQTGLRLPKNNWAFIYAMLLGIMYVAGIVKFAIANGYPLPIHPSIETLFFQATMPGLAEEALYRGVYLAVLNNYLGRAWSVLTVKFGWGLVLVTLLFVLGHVVHYDRTAQQIVYNFELIDLVQLSILGLTLAIIREKSESIWPAVVFHNICNVGVYLYVLA